MWFLLEVGRIVIEFFFKLSICLQIISCGFVGDWVMIILFGLIFLNLEDKCFNSNMFFEILKVGSMFGFKY